MLIAITGTPGVGKSTVAKILAERLGYRYIDLKEFASEHNIGEEKEGELELDIDELSYRVEKELRNKNAVIDGHLSHLLPVDQVVVIRTHPKVIGERLSERGYPKRKISENVEAELVDVCLVEAIDKHENVIEVDATNKPPEKVVDEILELLNKGVKRKIGIIDWTEVYDEIIPYLDLGGEE